MMTYDMEEFFRSCVTLYESLAPPQFKIKQALTPFPPDTKDSGPAGNPNSTGVDVIHCPWCQDSFPADLNIPKKAAQKSVASPHGEGTDVPGGTGVLQPHTATVLMKLLHGAPLARFDLLRAISHHEADT